MNRRCIAATVIPLERQATNGSDSLQRCGNTKCLNGRFLDRLLAHGLGTVRADAAAVGHLWHRHGGTPAKNGCESLIIPALPSGAETATRLTDGYLSEAGSGIIINAKSTQNVFVDNVWRYEEISFPNGPTQTPESTKRFFILFYFCANPVRLLGFTGNARLRKICHELQRGRYFTIYKGCTMMKKAILEKELVKIASLGRDRLEVIREKIEWAKQKKHNRGTLYHGQSSGYARCAYCQYVANHDIERFRYYASQAPKWRLIPYLLYEKGCDVEIRCLRYAGESILTGIAGGNFRDSIALASVMGSDLELFKKVNDVESYYFGILLKAFLTRSNSDVQQALTDAKEKIVNKNKRQFLGYVLIIEGCFTKNVDLAVQGFEDAIKFFRRSLDKRNGNGGDHLFTEGVGLANMCRWKGIWVEGFEPLIPKELLFSQNEIDEFTDETKWGSSKSAPDDPPLPDWN